MADENKKPRNKDTRYLGLIIAIVAIVVTIILAIWQYSPPPPDFSISVKPMQGTVHQGAAITTDVTIKGVHGYEEPVSLSATGQPSGVVLAFAPQSAEAKPSYTSRVTINVNSNVLVDDYTIGIKGTGADGKEHSCSYTLTVKPSVIPTPPVTPTPTPTPTPTLKPLISVSPEPISFNLGSMSAGETASRTILISNAGGGTLTWSVSDDQLWMTVNPMSGTNSGSVTINIDTTGMSQGSHSGSITITSNGGSKRGSVNLNIPQPPKLTVTILEVASGKLYITDELNYGSRVSIDRDYKFTEIQSFLQGKTYIITAMDDKFRTDNNFLKFSVDQEVIVYVAYDDRYTSKPSWLTDFRDTDKDLAYYGAGDKKVTCSLYDKRFPKGEIVFGGNYVEGEGHHSMYTVVVSEK